MILDRRSGVYRARISGASASTTLADLRGPRARKSAMLTITVAVIVCNCC
jgi:hypothetical protein